MAMKLLWLAVFFGFGILSSATPSESGAAEKRPRLLRSDGPLELEADTITVDQEQQSIEAAGNVRVRRGETEIMSDRLRFNRKTEEAFAEGTVLLKDPSGTLKADSVLFNLSEETAKIVNGNLYIETNRFRLTGRTLEKFPGQRYLIREGEFTTCACALGPPPWKLTARELELTPDGRAIVRGATFRVLDVPVLYIPRAFYPVKKERQTGFLLPRLGGSSKDGFKLELPFYWAPTPSTDATLALSVQTETRTGFLAEWRQMFSRESQIESNLAFYNEGQRTNESKKEATGNLTIADTHIPINRGSFASKTNIQLGAGWKSYGDIFLVSDDVFLRELHGFSLDPDEERQTKTRRFSESRVGLWKSWDSYALSGLVSYFQDYVEDDDLTLQRLPSMRLFGAQSLFGTPIELRLRSEASHFWRETDATGFRGDFNPEIVFPVGYGDYFYGALGGQLRQTFYQLTRSEGSANRTLGEFRGKVGTLFERVFQRPKGAFKHTIEPEIEYLYIPSAKEGELPLFDEVDRIGRRNQFLFSVTSRILLRTPREPGPEVQEELPAEREETVRESLFLRISQSYDFDGQEGEKSEKLSGIDLEAKWVPWNFASLGFTSVIDPKARKLSALSVTLSVSDPRKPPVPLYLAEMRRASQLDLSYRFVTDKALNELNGGLRLKINDYLGLAAHSIYDVNHSRFLRNRGSVRIISRCDCWVLDLGFGRTTHPDKTEVLAQLTLAGLGSAGKDPYR
jgi:LPS-assembly protein